VERSRGIQTLAAVELHHQQSVVRSQGHPFPARSGIHFGESSGLVELKLGGMVWPGHRGENQVLPSAS